MGICVGAGKHVTGVLSRPGRGNPWEVEVDQLASLVGCLTVLLQGVAQDDGHQESAQDEHDGQDDHEQYGGQAPRARPVYV